MDLKRFVAAYARLAFLLDGVEEIRDQAAMPVVREGHGIGAGSAATGRGGEFDCGLVLKVYLQGSSLQQRRAAGSDQFDALGETRVGGDRRVDHTERAVFEAHGRGGEVFG